MSDLPHIHDFVCFTGLGCPLDRDDQEPDCKHGYFADQGCPWCAKRSTEPGDL